MLVGLVMVSEQIQEVGKRQHMLIPYRWLTAVCFILLVSPLVSDCVTTAVICPPSVLLEDMGLSELGFHNSTIVLILGCWNWRGWGCISIWSLRTTDCIRGCRKAYQFVGFKSIGNSWLWINRKVDLPSQEVSHPKPLAVCRLPGE